MENQDQYLQKLDALLSDNPEAKHLYDMLVGAMVGDDDDGEMEVSVIEIDGKDYFIAKEFVIKGTTYVHLVSETDPLDFMYRKITIEDGEEYLERLDSEQEFELVVAYEQKYVLRDLKRKQDMMAATDCE